MLGDWPEFWTGKTIFLPKEEVPHASLERSPSRDSWEVDYRNGIVIRNHVEARTSLFDPQSVPIPVPWLTGRRISVCISEETNKEKTVRDDLSKPSASPFHGAPWTGKTYFLFEAGTAIDPHAKERERLQKSLPGFGTVIEFCCDESSNMGQVSQTIGLKHVRLTKSVGNMSDPHQVSQLLDELESGDLWGSLPCTYWSRWQFVNSSRLRPRFRAKLAAKRQESRQLLQTFLRVAGCINHSTPRRSSSSRMARSMHRLELARTPRVSDTPTDQISQT